MTQRIRVGVVGTSGYADFMHLPSLASHPQAEIAAICGRTQSRATEVAQKYGIPQVWTDYRDMLAKSQLDAVVVAVPDDLHYMITSEALTAGLHVLCEKPLALTAPDAWSLYHQAEERNRIHLVHFTYRWRPWYRYMQQLVAEGYIGRCYDCQFRCLGGYGRNGQYGWRFDRSRGHGILADLGSHMIDLARWIVGDISDVNADLATFVARPGPDGEPLDPANDSAMLTLRFANGAQGSVHVGAVAHLGERGMEKQVTLHGSEGTLEAIERGAAWELWGVRDGMERMQQLEVPEEYWGDVDQAKHLEVFVKQSAGARHFIDAILAGTAATPSFFDGAKAQDVIDAALASNEQRCWKAVGDRE